MESIPIIRKLFGRKPEPRLLDNYREVIRWIEDNTIPHKGIRITSRLMEPYPEVTGYIIPPLLEFGHHALAVQYCTWLLSVKDRAGYWYGSDGTPSFFDTGQVLRGLMAMRDYYLIRGKDAEADTVYTAVVRAINWMVGQIEGDGTILNQSREVFQFRPGEYAPEAVYLYALEPLLRACKSYRRDEEILARVKESIVRYTPRTVPETLDHYQYYIGEALFDLGIIPPLFNSPPPKYTTTPGKYQEFIIMKKRGFDIPGLVYTGLNGNHEDYFMNESIPWAAKFFLDALYWEMRISFHQDQEHPYCISNEDPRMEALRKNVVGYRVLDAGAGTGRYAYQLMQEHPCWKFQCCDIADDMVSFMRSRCIPADRASLMNLPYHPDQFDCAYCIEALEHAVNKPAAIAELCRVVRSNGRVIIIDKSEDTTVPMRLAPWEEWPRKYDVMRELGKYCVDCRYTDIDNIFTAWVGVVE